MPVPEGIVPSALGFVGGAVVFAVPVFVLADWGGVLEFTSLDELQPDMNRAESNTIATASLPFIGMGYSPPFIRAIQRPVIGLSAPLLCSVKKQVLLARCADDGRRAGAERGKDIHDLTRCQEINLTEEPNGSNNPGARHGQL